MFEKEGGKKNEAESEVEQRRTRVTQQQRAMGDKLRVPLKCDPSKENKNLVWQSYDLYSFTRTIYFVISLTISSKSM